MHNRSRGRGGSWRILRSVLLYKAVLTAMLMLVAGFPFQMSDIMLHSLGYFRHDPMWREKQEEGWMSAMFSFPPGRTKQLTTPRKKKQAEKKIEKKKNKPIMINPSTIKKIK